MLRIAHYNILQGGETRLSDIAKVIKEINPDICGILEAVNWQTDLRKFRLFCESLGYRYFDIAIANYRYNIVIFSKIAINVQVIRLKLRHVILKATVLEGEFKSTKLYFVHLSPFSEGARLAELRTLLTRIDVSKNIIVLGDFNSLSHRDPYDKKKLLKIFQDASIKKYGVRTLRLDVIKRIERAGLCDAAKYLKQSFVASTPTLSNVDKAHATKLRIDYAFLSKSMLKHLKRMKIFKSTVAEKASDHYPLFIELT